MVARHLTMADVIAAHARAMERLGGQAQSVRDEGLLESAMTRPRMAEYYEGADIVRQAALLATGISQAQAFTDGNKRTALVATTLFLISNSYEYVCDYLAFARQLERVAEAIGERADAESHFEEWLRSCVITAESA
ncbi:MAG TPA: type II toxin-antitoxin system death-on-curing family toxin [Thermomicrobiales bacterium]|nr:type II toxin-antitoxin system death-on-curing family toxin [Thermomicrobiales bacterium]